MESTYNWYWLMDSLMEEGYEGYKVHLANPFAMKQYEGIKHLDDALGICFSEDTVAG